MQSRRVSRLARSLVFPLLLVPLVLPTEALAASNADKTAAGTDTVYFEKGDFGTECTVNTTSTGGGDNVDGFLRALADQESGGNPKAESSISTASGKYQYIDGTWSSRVRGEGAIYPPGKSYERAKDAPEAVQDAVAYIEYTKKFAELDNSIFNLAISHFYPAALTDKSLLDKLIGGNSITPREYGESMVKKVREGVGSKIPLKYGDAPDIDKYLDAPESIPSESSSSSSSDCADSQDVATGQGIESTVLAYAWPSYTEGKTEKKPAYQKAVTRAKSKGQYTGDTCFGGGVDCGAFVTRLLIDSGFEPDYNYGGKGGNTDYQLKWLKANWQELGRGNKIDPADLQPGDVAIVVYPSGDAHHTFVFVGDIKGFNSNIASASQCQRAPMAGAESKTGSDVIWFRRKE